MFLFQRRYPKITLAIFLGLSIIWSASASALTMSEIPIEDRPDWYDTADPDVLAFAYYDYTAIEGREGAYTHFEEGVASLFDETQSGISEMAGDWSWIYGQGWTTYGSSITFHWKNIRVPTNNKFFAQSVKFGGGTVTGIEVTTDDNNDAITFPGWVIHDNRLIINAKITPQPNDVWVKINFAVDSPLVIEEGWVLDQCTPIPEPCTLFLLGSGLAGVIGFRRKILFRVRDVH